MYSICSPNEWDSENQNKKKDLKDDLKITDNDDFGMKI